MIRFIMNFSVSGMWIMALIWIVNHDERVTTAALWTFGYCAVSLGTTLITLLCWNVWNNTREARAAKKRDDAKYEN